MDFRGQTKITATRPRGKRVPGRVGTGVCQGERRGRSTPARGVSAAYCQGTADITDENGCLLVTPGGNYRYNASVCWFVSHIFCFALCLSSPPPPPKKKKWPPFLWWLCIKYAPPPFLCIYVCVYAHIYACVDMHICKHAHAHRHTLHPTHELPEKKKKIACINCACN